MNIATPTNTSATLLLTEPEKISKNRGKLPPNKHTSATYYASLSLSTGSTLQVVTTSASAVQEVLPLALSQTYKTEVPDMKEIPYDEGMTIYRQIKQRHSQLFHDLADL